MSKFQSIAIRSLFIGILGLMLGGCGKKNDPKEALDTFFSLLQKGDTTAAYQSTTLAFQTEQTLQGFDTQARELGVAGFKALEWTPSVAHDKELKIEGNITLKDGGKRFLIATLIQESGRWGIYRLQMRTSREQSQGEIQFTQVGQSAAFTQVYKPSPPTEQQTLKLVR